MSNPMQLTVEATHFLESQGQGHEQGQNVAHHRSHSHSKESRTGVLSRV